MRDLDFSELQYVSGAGDSPTPPSGCGCSPTPPTHEKKRKGNNGFGNGGNDGSPNGFQDQTR
jgi:hypothetical protein